MILGELGHPGMDGGLGDLPGTGCGTGEPGLWHGR